MWVFLLYSMKNWNVPSANFPSQALNGLPGYVLANCWLEWSVSVQAWTKKFTSAQLDKGQHPPLCLCDLGNNFRQGQRCISFVFLFCLHPWGQRKRLEKDRWQKGKLGKINFLLTLLTDYTALCKRKNAFCYTFWICDWRIFSMFLLNKEEKEGNFSTCFQSANFLAWKIMKWKRWPEDL